MLQNMFVGNPEGNYDAILDFSTALTGSLYFVPSLPLLESLSGLAAEAADEAAPAPAPTPPAASDDGSLGIGSLR